MELMASAGVLLASFPNEAWFNPSKGDSVILLYGGRLTLPTQRASSEVTTDNSD